LLLLVVDLEVGTSKMPYVVVDAHIFQQTGEDAREEE